jgi:hypothetical protein
MLHIVVCGRELSGVAFSTQEEALRFIRDYLYGPAL